MLYELKIQDFLDQHDIASEPESFKTYSEKATGKSLDPWSHISIDSIQKLRPELRAANMVVLRLGSRPDTKGSYFSLVKAKASFADFFFEDDKLFSALHPELFLPDVSIRSLFPFQLLPKVTETSIVNLALASGLLPYALGVEKSDSLLIPATGQSDLIQYFWTPR